MSNYNEVIEIILNQIECMSNYKNIYSESETAFSRSQKLDFEKTILLMLGMQDRTLPKELYDAEVAQFLDSLRDVIKSKQKLSRTCFTGQL